MTERFDLSTYSPIDKKGPRITLYCPTHSVEFCDVNYPPKPHEHLGFEAAKSVALDHMTFYKCRVMVITPREFLC